VKARKYKADRIYNPVSNKWMQADVYLASEAEAEIAALTERAEFARGCQAEAEVLTREPEEAALSRGELREKVAQELSRWLSGRRLGQGFPVMEEADRILALLPASDEAWHKAAQVVGENMGTAGPVGYYDFTAEEWRDWVFAWLKTASDEARQEFDIASGYHAKWLKASDEADKLRGTKAFASNMTQDEYDALVRDAMAWRAASDETLREALSKARGAIAEVLCYPALKNYVGRIVKDHLDGALFTADAALRPAAAPQLTDFPVSNPRTPTVYPDGRPLYPAPETLCPHCLGGGGGTGGKCAWCGGTGKFCPPETPAQKTGNQNTDMETSDDD
jgi:hypothetical protein